MSALRPKNSFALLFMGSCLVSSLASAQTILIVPLERTDSSSMKESNSSYTCPSDKVLTGRMHTGDENGQTTYQCASLEAIDADTLAPISGTIRIEAQNWSGNIKESSGTWYNAPAGMVLIGRAHDGDENGNTRYRPARITLNGRAIEIIDSKTSGDIKESSGTWFKTETRQVMTGRMHKGDENKYTQYKSGTMRVTGSASSAPQAEGSGSTQTAPDAKAPAPQKTQTTPPGKTATPGSAPAPH
ncbi:hypothetical protein [Melittangium boletus]|uniref:Lipoprotein n=1 Tax=Melittangium boletus DSM 14713 TaxID=1294270 RepID=A0A250IG77_9BACT|nr:hypothetical protein [Melittangium boletus]ATB30172.1 hypothetical protein MEBOL_003627 [Melittangium boletus DSM 14713]